VTADPVIARAFIAACDAELQAIKPGNVHIHAPGHRMTVADFEVSARVSAPFIAKRGASIGARVLGAVQATKDAVGQNTNLGILLLCAPIAAAAEHLFEAGPATPERLRDALRRVLAATTVADAAAVYQAIRIASPAGLGHAEAEDVASAPTVPLTETMRLAAGRDRIARQYVTAFDDVFDIGVPIALAASDAPVIDPWTTTAIMFAFASRLPDSHIIRKYGEEFAESICTEFSDKLFLVIGKNVNRLKLFDANLKVRSVNPGTSADLTVASVFISSLLGRKSHSV
jgi:triphosphoribosyl-dephospho-CoA synthase